MSFPYLAVLNKEIKFANILKFPRSIMCYGNSFLLIFYSTHNNDLCFSSSVFQNSPLNKRNNYNFQTIDAVPSFKYQDELSDRNIILFIKYFNVSYTCYRVSCIDCTNVCDLKFNPPHLRQKIDIQTVFRKTVASAAAFNGFYKHICFITNMQI